MSLQAFDHFSGESDPLSEDEIIPLSGVSKSGTGCIIHAGGAVGRGHDCGPLGALGRDAQDARVSADTAAKVVNFSERIFQFLGFLGVVRLGQGAEPVFFAPNVISESGGLLGQLRPALLDLSV